MTIASRGEMRVIYAVSKDLSSDSICRVSRIYVTCYGHACPTQTPRYASGRALIRLITGGLLKRAALERKKSAGAYRALSPLASLR